MRNNLIVTIKILLAFWSLSATAQTTRRYILVARSNVGTATMWDNTVLRIYSFTPTLATQPALPGIKLYAEEGDSIYIEMRAISQGDEHTLHLHGFDSRPKHDGDPLTSHPIGHLQGRIYAYKATHCGTFIYHCHVEDAVHVQMGMYGLLIVKPLGGLNTAWTNGPAYEKEYSWLMSEIDQKWHEKIPKMIGDTLKVPPYRPNYFLINGKSEQQITANDSIKITGIKDETIYLRTANIGYFKNVITFPPELNATIVDSDGRPLSDFIKHDTLEIMPGERYGVMLKSPSVFSGNIVVNYISMNSDSIWNTQKVPVNIGVLGIQETGLSSLVEIYPNPTSNYVDVLIKEKSDIKINGYSIINALGQRVGESILQKNANQISSFSVDVSYLPSGLYYLRLSLNDEFVYKKVLVEK
jgi:FtsP/CotA-like multicopper oxidase with cupredoxin domain